jgi:hypothetical protein
MKYKIYNDTKIDNNQKTAKITTDTLELLNSVPDGEIHVDLVEVLSSLGGEKSRIRLKLRTEEHHSPIVLYTSVEELEQIMQVVRTKFPPSAPPQKTTRII